MTFYSGYQFNGVRTEVFDDDGNPYDFCEKVEVTEVQPETKTRKEFWAVGVTHADGSVVKVRGEKADFVKNPIGMLSNFGLNVSFHNEYTITLAEILMETALTAPRADCHTQLGWDKVAGQHVFCANEIIGPATKASVFANPEMLESKGTEEEWLEGVRRFAAERPLIMLVVAMMVCAPLAAILSEIGVLKCTLVLALIAASSQSKSTVLELAASAWGNPSTQGGLLEILNCTDAFIYGSLANRRGFPSFWDDLSAIPKQDLTSMLYTVSLSQERGRCNADGTPKPRKTWSGAVILTGETSIFNQTNKNDGLYARCLVFPFKWVETAEEAEEISAFAHAQHGTASRRLLECLLQIDHEDLRKLYNLWLEQLVNRANPRNGVERRVLKSCAALMLSAQIAEAAWEVPMDYPKLTDLMLQVYEHTIPERSLADRAYSYLIAWVMSHLDKFPSLVSVGEDETKVYNFSFWGVRGTHREWGKRCVWIEENRFEDVLQKGGFPDCTRVCRELHETNRIYKGSGRFRKKKKISSFEPVCFCLALTGLTDDEAEKIREKEEEEQRRKARRAERLALKKSQQLINLLADEPTEDGENADK